MSVLETKFHETWLGMVQPIDGLVLSVPVLVDAQCMAQRAPAAQALFRELCPVISTRKDGSEQRRIASLPRLFSELLGLTPDLFDEGEALPAELSLYIPEGKQRLRPTHGLRKQDAPASRKEDDETGTPESRAGQAYEALIWELPAGLSFDSPETVTGSWHYPPSQKLDRLLRACRVPFGLLVNGEAIRLLYAPHGESSGSMTFRVDDMASVGGRPILDAFTMLFSATRLFGVAEEQTLSAMLRQSRLRQANVTNALAEQVSDALRLLLRGFEAAAERDGRDLFEDALAGGPAFAYGGLLTVLLRLVFLLYAEDRGLLPNDHDQYAEHMSVLGLFEELAQDNDAFPDAMSSRFGAYSRLLSLFRAVFYGARRGTLKLPARRGELFDPGRYPFLEGWGPAGAAPVAPLDRTAVRVPTVDDGTVYQVLEKLLLLGGQRLSYRALDVEQIGSVYEALMGFTVERVPSSAICLRPSGTWVVLSDVLEQPKARRAAYLEELAAVPKNRLSKLAAALSSAKSEDDLSTALEGERLSSEPVLGAGRLVIQPGVERRRTSSHYTPRSLSAPIVSRTLEPLLAAMGSEPSSDRLLNLKVCDPAMGSGAFLVEACRFLADRVVAAWTREAEAGDSAAQARLASTHDDVVNHARRLVAQRCLYGVDKNPFAVSLAKLSLWLVTLAKDEPFTFVDHALRYGDSLVGLNFEQLRGFSWAPVKQLPLFQKTIDKALGEAIELRQGILDLAKTGGTPEEKEYLLSRADEALDRARLLGDLVVAAFFSSEKDKERGAELTRSLDAVTRWLEKGDEAPEALREKQRLLREGEEGRPGVPTFHWMLEFPEVFFAEREDPLDHDQVNRAAWMDAFVGNPPFAGKNGISEAGGSSYLPWLQAVHEGAHGNADLSAHFFRRANALLGKHGAMGLIATNTIGQGDTRSTALQALVQEGLSIYHATRSMKWPGTANVAVSVVHLAKGSVVDGIQERVLDELRVPAINSRLRGKPERSDPVVLVANAGKSFQGSIVLGMGFTLTPEERDELVRKSKKNAERIFPYLGGEEVNTSPTQSFHRYVISFGQMSLEEAERWPDLLAIVREKVKPERDKLKDTQDGRRLKQTWWLFCRDRPQLAAAIAPLARCLVTARVTKHLCMSFQPRGVVFSEQLFTFALALGSHFALLQSRIHEPWARLLSSSLEDRLRYSASDCFETFPFPPEETLVAGSALDKAGEELYAARAAFMVDTQQGLTTTYNLLKDPAVNEARVVHLRELHEAVDRAVLAAYGWDDVPLPAYGTPTTPAAVRALEAFEDEVIDRLFALNAERAAEERRLGLGSKKVGKGAGRRGQDDDDDGQMTLV